MNEKLEKLNQEIEKTEKKLRWAEQEEKRLTHQIKTLTRKERLFLKLLFHKDSTRQLMEKVFAGNGTEKEGAE